MRQRGSVSRRKTTKKRRERKEGMMKKMRMEIEKDGEEKNHLLLAFIHDFSHRSVLVLLFLHLLFVYFIFFLEKSHMLISRLAPQDYHRFHMPLDGKTKKMTMLFLTTF